VCLRPAVLLLSQYFMWKTHLCRKCVENTSKGIQVEKVPTSGYMSGADWWLDTDEKPMSRDAASVDDV